MKGIIWKIVKRIRWKCSETATRDVVRLFELSVCWLRVQTLNCRSSRSDGRRLYPESRRVSRLPSSVFHLLSCFRALILKPKQDTFWPVIKNFQTFLGFFRKEKCPNIYFPFDIRVTELLLKAKKPSQSPYPIVHRIKTLWGLWYPLLRDRLQHFHTAVRGADGFMVFHTVSTLRA